VILFKVSLSFGYRISELYDAIRSQSSCRRRSVLVQPVCQLNCNAMTATGIGNRRLQGRRALVLG